MYAWDAAKKAWQADPVATSDRVVSGERKVWQHNLTLHAPAGSALAKSWKAAPPKLAAGKYLVKVYLDGTGKLAKDWRADLGDDDYVGQAVLDATWPTGHKTMTVLDAAAVK